MNSTTATTPASQPSSTSTSTSATKTERRRSDDHDDHDVDATVIAWTEPKKPSAQKARRVKVWLTKSIHNLSSPKAVDFFDPNNSDDILGDDVSSSTTSSFRQQQQRRDSFSSMSSHISTTTSRKTTSTIDQAMFSLYTYVGPKHKATISSSAIQVQPETPSIYVPGHDYDWLLDGGLTRRPSNNEEVGRYEEGEEITSQKYLDYLNQPWDMEGFLDTYLQQREQTIQEEEQQEEKAFQFEANFNTTNDDIVAVVDCQQSPSTTTTNNNNNPSSFAAEEIIAKKEENNNDDSEDEEDDFGDFQDATPIAAPASTAPTSTRDDDDDIFQTPHPTTIKKKSTNNIPPTTGRRNLGNDFDQEQGAGTTDEDEEEVEVENKTDDDDDDDDGEEEMNAKQVEVENKTEDDDDDEEEMNAKDDSNSTTKEVDEEEEEEEKSQEEVIVEEAVEILKSLPSAEIKKTPVRQILMETCNLASELEREQEQEQEGGQTDNKDATTTTSPVAFERARQEQQGSCPDKTTTTATSEDQQSLSLKPNAAPIQQQQQSEADETSPSSVSANQEGEVTTDKEDGPQPPPNPTTDQKPASTTTDDSQMVESSSSSPSTTVVVVPASTTEQKEDQLHGANNISSESVVGSDDDDSFGDFQDVAPAVDTSASHEKKTTNIKQGKPLPTTHAESQQQHQQQQQPPQTRISDGNDTPQTAGGPSSIRPTFAVLPPLKVDTAIKVQQQAEQELVQHHQQVSPIEETRQPTAAEAQASTEPQPPRPQDTNDDPIASISNHDCSVSEYNDDELSADDSAASENDEEQIRISWRLPITDLSTPVARFARRQRKKYKEAVKLKRAIDQPPPDSTASLFSVREREPDDDDEDGDPLIPLADLDLPHYYFTQAEFDDTTRVLQSLPWHHIAHMWDLPPEESMGLNIASSYSFEEQLDKQALWDEYITQELCHLDSAQNQVARHLLRRIQPHGAVLQKANQGIFELKTHIQLAQMYLRRSQASVRQAARGPCDSSNDGRGGGWFGAHGLLEDWDRQEMYSNLDGILAKIQEILGTEKSLQECISSYTFQANKPREYYIITQQVLQLHSDVIENSSLSRVNALNDLRVRLARNEMLHSFHNRLHTLAEWVGVRCCRSRKQGLSREYSALLEAAMEVHSLITIRTLTASSDEYDKTTHENTNGDSNTLEEQHEQDTKDISPPHLSSLPSLVTTWPKTLLEALCYEADRAFATALLDPLVNPNNTSTETSIDSEYERELTQLAYEIQQDWGDSARLKTITHNLVIIRFDWENSSRYFLSVFHRLCRILGDVLYAHHMMGTWHERMAKEIGSRAMPGEETKEEKKEMSEEQLHHSSYPLDMEGDSIIFQEEKQKIVEAMRLEWAKSQTTIWQRCEEVMVKCLDEYLHFASSQKLFKETQSSKDAGGEATDSPWRHDLEELHSVLTLAQEFSSLRSRFFVAAQSNSDPSELGPKLKDKLCDVFRKHLRFVHVEAMKTLGSSLSRENWELVPLKQLSDFEKSVRNAQPDEQEEASSLKDLLVGALSNATESIDKGESKEDSRVSQQRSLFLSTSTSSSSVNRFLIRDEFSKSIAEATKLHDTSKASSTERLRSHGEVYDLITSVLAEGDKTTCFARIASKSIADVFLSWITRLLVIMEKLPLIVEDVSVVFANLCDLYYTTVFRVCAGSAAAERILLGIEPPTPSVSSKDLQPVPPPKSEKNPSSPAPLFAFRRRSSSSLGGGRKAQMKIELPATLEADLIAPLMCETSKLSATCEFVKRAQKTLASIVLLDKVNDWIVDPDVIQSLSGGSSQEDDNLIVKVIRNLEQRIGAAWSCLGVGAMLDAACVVALDKLSYSPQALDDFSTLQHYNQAALRMLPELIRLSSRISTVRAVMARRVVAEVMQVGPGWETDQMNEHANIYVDSLASRCSCIWASLSVSPKKLPVGLLRETWKTLIEGGYTSLLEGFSRVPLCSTEGRALMSMDLASFAAAIHPSAVMERLEYQIEYEAPPKTEPENGMMRYVDTYVKAFYYPKKDVMAWIIENHEKYQLNHFLKLTAYTYRDNDGEGATVQEAIELVKKMFEDEGKENRVDSSV